MNGRDFVMVHGNWHGAWCWQPVARLLQQQGHRVVAVDLPGSASQSQNSLLGIDLHRYVEALLPSLHATPSSAIVVMHSMAGALGLSLLARQAPVAALVYVAAYAPAAGSSVGRQAQTDQLSQLPPFLRLERSDNALHLDPAAFDVMYKRLDAPTRRWAEPQVSQRTPARPSADALPLIEQLNVPSFGLVCEHDEVFSAPAQRQAYAAWGMDTSEHPWGHFPMLEAPHALAERLLEIIGTEKPPAAVFQ